METCGIPTALLSNHTGFKTFYSRDLTDELPPIGAQLKRENITFDAIYTGYIASVYQMQLISDFIDEFGENALIFIDPVMGDYGRFYSALSQDYPEHMLKLCAKADVISPNLTEACLLLGREYSPNISLIDINDMLKELFKLCRRYVFITGVRDGDDIGAVGYDGKDYHSYFTPHEDVACTGTGDVLSSAFLGAVMRGADFNKALDIAVSFTYEAVRITANDPERRFYGIQYELALPYYIEKMAEI